MAEVREPKHELRRNHGKATEFSRQYDQLEKAQPENKNAEAPSTKQRKLNRRQIKKYRHPCKRLDPERSGPPQDQTERTRAERRAAAADR